MATIFAQAMMKQCYGNVFETLEEPLGSALVAAIPVHKCNPAPGDNSLSGKYVAVFTNPDDMPADVVKGILPDGRPFVCFRYVLDGIKRVGTIMRRYNESEELGDYNRWTGSSDRTPNKDPFFTEARLSEREFAILKGMLTGASLDQTEGRYLPLFAGQFSEHKEHKSAETREGKQQ